MSAASEILRAAGACDDAIKWAEPYGTLQAAWDACDEVEWLCLWIDHFGETPQRHLLMADLAESALPIYERHVPGDTRVRDAIQARRAYARGEITWDHCAAVRDAAWAVARDAARVVTGAGAKAAVRAAARAAAAWYSAGAAARAAAWAAAWDVARSTMWSEALEAAVDAALERQRPIILRHYPTPPTLEGVR